LLQLGLYLLTHVLRTILVTKILESIFFAKCNVWVYVETKVTLIRPTPQVGESLPGLDGLPEGALMVEDMETKVETDTLARFNAAAVSRFEDVKVCCSALKAPVVARWMH
jgi:hypothetical protein